MRIAGLVVGVGLMVGCGDGASGACGEVPELVMKFEPGALGSTHRPYQVGERVLLAGNHSPGVSVFMAERCGDGVPEQVVGPELGLDWIHIIETAAGDLLIGRRRATGELVHVDRLDVPGRDTPQTIRAFEPGDGVLRGTRLFGGGLMMWTGEFFLAPVLRPDSPRTALEFYPGPGGYSAPPVLVAEELVWFDTWADDRLYALNASGELLTFDALGEPRLQQAGVRAVSLAPDHKQLVWQALGDGAREPVYLRTLATGVDVALGVLDLAEVPNAGDWLWTDEALALVGPAGTLVRAYARVDGGALPRPPQLEVYRYGGLHPGRDLFILLGVEAFEMVGLAWDPVADTVIEWHRGAPADIPIVERTPDGLVYGVWDPAPGAGRLWRSRLDGRRAELLVRGLNLFGTVGLPGGRVLVELEGQAPGAARLVVIDAQGRSELLAREVGTWGFGRDREEILYTRVDGPDAGVWARPL